MTSLSNTTDNNEDEPQSAGRLNYYEQDKIKKDLCDWAKYRADKKGLEYSITPRDLFLPSCCPVFKTPFVRGDYFKAASLDRIDSSKGYVKGNVVVISRRANSLKSDGTLQELKAICDFYERLAEATKT